jgi:hypothetical protein
LDGGLLGFTQEPYAPHDCSAVSCSRRCENRPILTWRNPHRKNLVGVLQFELEGVCQRVWPAKSGRYFLAEISQMRCLGNLLPSLRGYSRARLNQRSHIRASAGAGHMSDRAGDVLVGTGFSPQNLGNLQECSPVGLFQMPPALRGHATPRTASRRSSLSVS